jgi:aspartate racemase
MKTLGMIGGTSWHSTIDYYRLINELAGEKIGNHANPPLILYSLNIAVMREGNLDKINETYLDVSQKLQEAGAQGIIICANTPHMVYPFVAPKISIPIIHIGDATAEHAVSLGIKKLGLLGTKATMERDFLKHHLRNNFGIDTLTPGLTARDEIHRLISEELTQGVFTDETKTYFIEEMDKLKLQGAEGIILGCTELPLLLKPEDFELPLLNTLQLHAQKAVKFILEDEEQLSDL